MSLWSAIRPARDGGPCWREPRLGPALVVVALVATLAAAPAYAAATAPDGPGALSHFDLARKDCVGTARNAGSKVWYTVAGRRAVRRLQPTIDNTNVETMQYVVTDGRTFTDLQTRDMTYTVRSPDRSGMACTVTSTARAGTATGSSPPTSPTRAATACVMRTRLSGCTAADARCRLYVRLDAIVNGNGGGGSGQRRCRQRRRRHSTGRPVPVVFDTNTVTNAANRDYAVPTYMALRADRPFPAVGGRVRRHRQRRADPARRRPRADAPYDQRAGRQRRRDRALTLGPGARHPRARLRPTSGAAVEHRAASAPRDRSTASRRYADGWQGYDAGLRRSRPAHPGLPAATRPAGRAYYMSANVLKASEDKTFPGAIVASLASPWGQAVSAGDSGGKPVYFGSYREVFARDLYEAFTGLLAAGDLATARDTVRFLFERQQQPDGSMPRNSLLNGRTAPGHRSATSWTRRRTRS